MQDVQQSTLILMSSLHAIIQKGASAKKSSNGNAVNGRRSQFRFFMRIFAVQKQKMGNEMPEFGKGIHNKATFTLGGLGLCEKRIHATHLPKKLERTLKSRDSCLD